MKKNKKRVFFGIGILTIVMITGVTFALWQITLKQESENIISTSCFKIVMKEENPIRIQSAYPITDEEGLSLIPFTFTIENICDTYASFQINLEVLDETELENLEFLKISFESIDEVRKPVFLTTKEEVSPTLKDEMKNPISKKAYKLESGYLGVGEKRSYNISLWLDENTPALEEIMSKSFLSKISVIATYIKDYDKENPITNVEVMNLTNKIKVDASSSTDNTNIKYYYYSLDGESFIKTREPEYTFEIGTLEYGSAVDTIKILADSLEEEYTVYVKTEDEYGNVSDVVSEKVMCDFAYDNTADNNLRYIGADPNNYVSFNNELWRIIGVMNNVDDGNSNLETRVKLVREESIGLYSWDSSASGVNNGDGVNEWSQSKLKNMLNDFYYNRKLNQKCYLGSGLKTVECSFDTIGIQDDTKEFFQNALWYTGAYDANDTDILKTTLTKTYYLAERSKRTGKGCSNREYEYCNDNVTRTTTWLGMIGLINGSDYGYATSGGNTVSRNTCLNTPIRVWTKDCYENNWLNTRKMFWILNPAAKDSLAHWIMIISSVIGVNAAASDWIQTYPSLFLKENVKITSGFGIKEQPFKLSLD